MPIEELWKIQAWIAYQKANNPNYPEIAVDFKGGKMVHPDGTPISEDEEN